MPHQQPIFALSRGLPLFTALKTIAIQMKKRLLFLYFFAFFTFVSSNAQTLVWQDEFNGTSPDSSIWTYDLGDGCQRNLCGWGNAELQHYTSRSQNVRIENGNLIIEARRENYGSSSFTSGRIKSEGRMHFKYGTLEARIKIPNLANGIWPAFWTLGTLGGVWPAIGEIDIMEMGSQSARFANLINKQATAALHWSNNGSYTSNVGVINATADLNNDYHLFKLVWNSTSITMFLDNVQFHSFDISNPLTSSREEFHHPHFLLLNMAVGGSYTGLLNPNDVTATMPAQMLVDYVRLYQQSGDELYLASQYNTNGNIGVFTETTPVTDSVKLGTTASLNYWNNLSVISGATPYEGNQVWALRANAGNWFGMGMDNKYINLNGHRNGSLKFHFKTNYQGQFKIGMRTGDGESWINFPAGVSQFGLVRDGAWHEVNIPVAQFNNPTSGNYFDYLSVKSAFMFAGDAPVSNADFFIDNIYFTKNTITPSLGSFSVPAKVLGDSAFALIPPTSNSNGSFSYNSSNTSVATVSGNIVTIVGTGTSVITAVQSPSGLYGSASASVNLVVTIPVPANAAPNPPARNSADVISFYSNAYTNVSGIDWNQNWGQSTTVTEVSISGNPTRKYENFNYQGVQLSGSVNVSAMSYLHIDIWTPNCNTFDLYLINTSPGLVEQKVSLTPSFLGWNSFDIALTQYNTVNLSNIQQLKLVGTPFGSSIVYYDNLYFWRPSNLPALSNFIIPAKQLGDAPFSITPPTSNSTGAFTYSSSNTSVATVSGSTITIVGVGTANITATQAATATYASGTITTAFVVSYPGPNSVAAAPPARSTADYQSIFSDSYTNRSGTDFNPYWNQTTQVSEISIGANAIKKYENFNYQGIQLTGVADVSYMQYVHIDIWTPNISEFFLYLINTTPSLLERKVTLTPTLNGWNSYDIPLSSFSPVAMNNITQFKLECQPSGTGVLYWDNLYFWKASAITTPTLSVTQPSCSLSTGTIMVTSSVSGLSFSLDGVNYSNTNGVFSGLTPGVYSLTAKNSSGAISSSVNATINNPPLTPQPILSITGKKNINRCDTLQSYSVTSQSGVTFNWTVTGTGNYIKTGQGTNNITAVLKVAGTVNVYASTLCGATPMTTLTIYKSVPTTPAAIYSGSQGTTAPLTNICQFTQAAFTLSGQKDTFRIKSVANATSYLWQVPGGSQVTPLTDTSIAVIFADTLLSTAGSTAIISVRSIADCDTGLAKTVTLTRSMVTAPASITIQPVSTNICGARKYRYIAPVLPAGAFGYNWSFQGPLYATASVDSGTLQSRILTVVFTNNAAASSLDSVKLTYVSGCGNSLPRALKLTNTLLSVPTAPASITVTSLGAQVCGQPRYRYSAPALPAATTTATAATGYVWTFVGTLGAQAVIDSGTVNTRTIVVRFTTNAAATTDSVKVRYTSACGNSLFRSLKLTNTLTGINPPLAPASITIALVLDSCNYRIYRYTAPTLPVGTTSVSAANGYAWTMPFGVTGSTGILDSGTLGSKVIRIRYASNAAASIGDSIKLRYTSVCGLSPFKAQKLSNLVKTCVTVRKSIENSLSLLNEPLSGIYPNPSNGDFSVRITTKQKQHCIARITIVDMYGRKLNSFLAKNVEGKIEANISLPNLHQGIYQLMYEMNGEKMTLPFMINK